MTAKTEQHPCKSFRLKDRMLRERREKEIKDWRESNKARDLKFPKD